MFPPKQFWDRREFLKLLGGAGLSAALPGFSASQSDTLTISVVHTTDLHGHILPTTDYDGTPNVGGLARCVTQIRRWRRQNPNTILLDVGDVYQGTDIGLRTRGTLMIDLFNHLKFDAWVVGNHEFDWGIDPFVDAVRKSTVPVLAANMSLGDIPVGQWNDARHPFSRIQPYVIKEFGGIRIAIIGITTPGMRFWFRPEFIQDLNFLYPIEPVRRAMVQAKHQGANAIVLAGHMGLKNRGGGDDFANSVVGLTNEFRDVTVFIAGHTHQLVASRPVNGVLVTQADHFGIHIGRVDLVFDRASKRLLERKAVCQRMDNQVGLDHTVLSRAGTHLDVSQAALAEPVGELAEKFGVHGAPGRPSDIEMLIGAAIRESLGHRGVAVDGVFHGRFDETTELAAGPKTIADVWNVLPFENYVVTAQLSAEELKTVMEEVYASHHLRSLIGFDVQTGGSGRDRHITSLAPSNGELRPRDHRYTIVFNTFDSRSAGHRFMRLRAILDAPDAKCTFHDLQTRDALIEYFRRHKVVRKSDLTCSVAAAA